ncbi:MAG: hypothetical protein FJ313_07255, partial [Gemmatimonadetes bacterium]|nr:hypothetical protein [Gemmatimonadota bacterium]
MDNSQDFARAERRSLALKAAVVTPAILAAGLLPGARWGLTGAGGIAVACLALSGAAWLTARPSAFPLRRLAVLLVIEASLAAAGLYALGTLGPAAALPAAFAAHYACLLGPRGAAAAGAAALIALAGAVACGAGPVAGSFALAGPLILSAAAFPAYAARQRDETAARLESTRIGALDEAHARRVLSGLRTVASADTESHTARALAAALSAVTGYPAAAVFLRAFGSEELVFAAADMGEREAILAGAAPEPIDAHTPAALAVRGGASVPLGSTDGAAPLPAWARERGFTSGIAAPIATGVETLGAAYV